MFFCVLNLKANKETVFFSDRDEDLRRLAGSREDSESRLDNPQDDSEYESDWEADIDSKGEVFHIQPMPEFSASPDITHKSRYLILDNKTFLLIFSRPIGGCILNFLNLKQ